jgi:drug/metabolite transporter (DMT)-like permease
VVALVAAVLPYVTGIAATRLLGSEAASFVGLTEVTFAVLFAWLLIGELPLPIQLAGGVLTVTGLVAVRYDELAAAVPLLPPAVILSVAYRHPSG